MGSLSLLQGIFPTQEFNQDLRHCRQILYQLSHQGSTSLYICTISSVAQLCPTLCDHMDCSTPGLLLNNFAEVITLLHTLNYHDIVNQLYFYLNKKKEPRMSLMVQWLRLHRGRRVQSLVGEVRFCRQQPKKEKEPINEALWFWAIDTHTHTHTSQWGRIVGLH